MKRSQNNTKGKIVSAAWKLFYEQGYDLRHGVAATFPVTVNDLLVRAVYTIKRHFVDRIAWMDCLPKGDSPELQRSKQMGMVPKVSIWISCALLYTLEVSPVFFRLQNGDGTSATVVAGLIIMALGICLEMAADLQKTAAKKKNPYRFVDSGLYRIVRCPNYLGELLLWLGVLISGFGSLHGIVQWGAAILGFILIVYIMFSGARRLEIRQDRNYAEDPEYRKYVKTVPILIPFIPLYSVRKYTFLVA